MKSLDNFNSFENFDLFSYYMVNVLAATDDISKEMSADGTNGGRQNKLKLSYNLYHIGKV